MTAHCCTPIELLILVAGRRRRLRNHHIHADGKASPFLSAATVVACELLQSCENDAIGTCERCGISRPVWRLALSTRGPSGAPQAATADGRGAGFAERFVGALARSAKLCVSTHDGPRSGFVKPLCNRKNHNIIYPPDAKFCLCGPFPTPKDFIGPLKHLLRYLFTPLLGSQSRRRRALAESGFVKPLALRAGTASWPTRSQAARSTLCVARG